MAQGAGDEEREVDGTGDEPARHSMGVISKGVDGQREQRPSI